MTRSMEHLETLVGGGGQAGLAVSHELTSHGVEHVVLERGRIGQSWRDRWDSFCLVTPNWSVQLPDGAYDGTDPDGFMPRDEIVAFLERYASRSRAPVREGVAVRSLETASAGGFVAASTIVDGLYFVGVPFLRTRKSPLLLGVGEDAAIVARTIAKGSTLA